MGRQLRLLRNQFVLRTRIALSLATSLLVLACTPPDERVPLPEDWVGARGAIVVNVTRSDGSPIEDLQCRLLPDDPAAWGEDIRSTGDAGICRFDGVGATGVEVQVGTYDRGTWSGRASTRATVPPNGSITVDLVVDP